jgi:hypothetical protein
LDRGVCSIEPTNNVDVIFELSRLGFSANLRMDVAFLILQAIAAKRHHIEWTRDANRRLIHEWLIEELHIFRF